MQCIGDECNWIRDVVTRGGAVGQGSGNMQGIAGMKHQYTVLGDIIVCFSIKEILLSHRVWC